MRTFEAAAIEWHSASNAAHNGKWDCREKGTPTLQLRRTVNFLRPNDSGMNHKGYLYSSRSTTFRRRDNRLTTYGL
eukprot:scaffold457595_cov25-Prasinocladus_malaysianus.AAC.1